MFNRYNGSVKPFALNATSGKRYPFAETTANNGIDENLNTNFLKGWEAGVNENGFPPMEWFNAVGYTSTYLAAYLYQVGIAEWNEHQEYYENSVAVDSDGVMAVSTFGVEATPNIGNDFTTNKWGGVKVKDASNDNEATTLIQLKNSTDIIAELATSYNGVSSTSHIVTIPKGKFLVIPEFTRNNPQFPNDTGTAIYFGATTENENVTIYGRGAFLSSVVPIGQPERRSATQFVVNTSESADINILLDVYEDTENDQRFGGGLSYQVIKIGEV